MANNTDTTASVRDALAAHPGATAAELADVTGLGRSTVQRVLGALEIDKAAERTSGGRDGGRRLPDRWQPVIKEKATSRRSASGGSSGPRLGKGELRALVLEGLVVAAEPIGPGSLARSLGRSSGAVSNACDRLVDLGLAERVGDRPSRFRAGPAEPAAKRSRRVRS